MKLKIFQLQRESAMVFGLFLSWLFCQEIMAQNCKCIDQNGGDIRMVSSLKNLASYDQLAEFCDWTLPDSSEGFKKLFFSRFVISDSRSRIYRSYITSKQPIRFNHPDETFTINFTPCPKPADPSYGHIPDYKTFVVVDIDHRIMEIAGRFDYTKFDGSASAYYDILKPVKRYYTDPAVLTHALEQLTRIESDYPELELNPFIDSVNKFYGLVLDKFNEESSQKGDPIESIVKALQQNNLNLKQVMLEALVLTDTSSNHEANPTERQRLERYFSNPFNNDYVSLKAFDEYIIYPNAKLYFPDANLVGIELNNSALDFWPQARTENPDTILTILDSVSDMEFATHHGLSGDFRHACFGDIRLGESQIGVSADHTELITKTRTSADYYQALDAYIQNFAKSHASRSLDFTEADLKQHMNFTGLYAPSVKLNLPVGRKPVLAKGHNFLFNNQLVAGTVIIPIEGQPKNGKVKLVSGKRKLKVKVGDLTAEFKKSGFWVSTIAVASMRSEISGAKEPYLAFLVLKEID